MPGTGHPAGPLTSSIRPAGTADPVRDLRWLLLSPPLLTCTEEAFGARVQGFDAAEQALIDPWLDKLARQPTPLQDFLATGGGPPVRLGRYAERLLEFFLREGPTHRLLASHLPLRPPAAGGATIGEIDFLLEDARGQRWHWELAVKFFLCTATGPQATPDDFVGPEGVEVFSHKLRKLFDRQLRHTPPPPWEQERWTPAAFVRGWMFYAAGVLPPHCPALSDQPPSGHWFRRQDLLLKLGEASPQERYLVLPKARWMSPARAAPGEILLDPAAMQAALAEAGSPCLLAHMAPGPHGWQESHRCFSVPDTGWPASGSGTLTPA